MRKITLLLVLVFSGLSVVFAVVQFQRSLENKEQSYLRRIRGLESQFQTAVETNHRLQSQLQTAEERTYQLQSQLRAAETELSKRKAPMARIVKDPKAMDEICRRHARQMDSTRGPQLKSLELAPDELKAFKDLLAESDTGFMRFALEVNCLPLKQREELGMRYETERHEIETEIRALLGENRFAAYENLEDTRPERTEVSLFNQALGAGEKLDAEGEQNLIGRLYTQRDRDSFPTSCYNEQTWHPFNLTEGGVAWRMGALVRLHEKYLVAARGALTESQLAQFRSFLERDRARQEKVIRHNMTFFPVPTDEAQAVPPLEGDAKKDF